MFRAPGAYVVVNNKGYVAASKGFQIDAFAHCNKHGLKVVKEDSPKHNYMVAMYKSNHSI